MKPGPKPKTEKIAWNSSLAYAIGLITTDGCLSSRNGHFDLTSNDIQLLNTFKKCLGISNRITPKVSGYTGKKSSYRIQFGNVILYKWLLNIGLMPNKTHRIGSLKVPHRYFFDFLRGHLDGDGCIRKFQDPIYPNSQRLYTIFHSASLGHIKWLQHKINFLLGIHGFLERTTREYRLTFAKKESSKLLPKIYSNPKVPCLKRKYKIAKSVLENKKPR